jgi:hypothetical protein
MLFFAALLLALMQAQHSASPSIVARVVDPPTRNIRTVYEDGAYAFVARDYGDARASGGNTEPGLFAKSKVRRTWIQIAAIATAGGRFGTSKSDDPGARLKLMMSSVGWDFRPLANQPFADQPLRTGSSIVFPDRVVYDVAGSRYELHYHSSWAIASAETVLYVKRRDLDDASAPPKGRR